MLHAARIDRKYLIVKNADKDSNRITVKTEGENKEDI